MTFFAGANVTAASIATLTAVIPGTGANVTKTFVDEYPIDANLLPPSTNWMSGPTPLLNTMRLSSTVLTGLATLANELGYFKYGLDSLVLDAELRFNMTFEKPEFSIVGEDLVHILLPSGTVSCTCMNSTNCTASNSSSFSRGGGGSSNYYRSHTIRNDGGFGPASDDFGPPPSDDDDCFGNMLQFNFKDVVAYTNLEYFNNLFQTGFTLNITSFNFANTTIELLHPKIPLPLTLLKRLMNDVINSEIPTANDLLAKNPVLLPVEVSKLFPPAPLMHVEHEDWPTNAGITDFQHGYLDALSFSTSSSAHSAAYGAYSHSDRRVNATVKGASGSGKYMHAIRTVPAAALPKHAASKSVVYNTNDGDNNNNNNDNDNDGDGVSDATQMLRLLIYTNTVSAQPESNAVCQLGGVGDSMIAVKLQPTAGVCKTLTVAGVNQHISYTLDSYTPDGHVHGLSFHTSVPCTLDPTTGKPSLMFCEVCNATVKTELCTIPPKARLNATSFGSFAVMPDSVAKMVNGKLAGPLQAGHVPAAGATTVTEVLWPSSLSCDDATQSAVQVVSYELAPTCAKDPASLQGSDTYYSLTDTANQIGGRFGCSDSGCASALCTIVIPQSSATNPTCAAKHVVIKPVHIDLNLSAILLPSTALGLLPPPPTTTTTTRTTTTKHNTTTQAPTLPPTPSNKKLDAMDKALIAVVCVLGVAALAAICMLNKRLSRRLKHRSPHAVGGVTGSRGGPHVTMVDNRGVNVAEDPDSSSSSSSSSNHQHHQRVCPKCGAGLPRNSKNFCTVCGHSLPADLKRAGLGNVDVSGTEEASEDDRLYRERQLQEASAAAAGGSDSGALADLNGLADQAKQYGKQAVRLAGSAAGSTSAAAKAASSRVWDWLKLLGRYFVGVSRHGLVVVTRALKTPQQPLFVRQTVGRISLLTSVMFSLHSILWATLQPFDAFSKNVFQQVGLTGSTLSADAMFRNMVRK